MSVKWSLRILFTGHHVAFALAPRASLAREQPGPPVAVSECLLFSIAVNTFSTYSQSSEALLAGPKALPLKKSSHEWDDLSVLNTSTDVRPGEC